MGRARLIDALILVSALAYPDTQTCPLTDKTRQINAIRQTCAQADAICHFRDRFSHYRRPLPDADTGCGERVPSVSRRRHVRTLSRFDCNPMEKEWRNGREAIAAKRVAPGGRDALPRSTATGVECYKPCGRWPHAARSSARVRGQAGRVI